MGVNRDITLLHPDLVDVYAEAKGRFFKAYPDALIVPRMGETNRSMDVQEAYYAQGRNPRAYINALRAKAGLYLLGPEEANKVVTWAKPGTSPHNFLPSRAFDVIMTELKTGKPIWDVKYYLLFARFIKEAAEFLGVPISQGAYWPRNKKDPPHTELKNWKTL